MAGRAAPIDTSPSDACEKQRQTSASSALLRGGGRLCRRSFCRRLRSPSRTTPFGDQAVEHLAHVRRFILEESIASHVLCANHSLAVDKEHEGNEGPLHRRPASELHHRQMLALTDRKRRRVARDERFRRNHTLGVYSSADKLHTLARIFFLDAVQDLNGGLTVRSSGE